ncbi:MAG TPA: hypothetical protein VG204_14115 [Terriglobia bacterium]|nr:hypothetical protein [Terriglobia bacterium]
MTAAKTATTFILLFVGFVFAAPGKGRPQRRDPEASVEGRAEEQAPTSHELYESGRLQFSAPPPTVVQTGVQCDANGNIYLVYGASFEATYVAIRNGVSLPVSKISPDAKSVVQFPIGQVQGYAEYHRMSYYVDPYGKVYALLTALPHERDYKGPNWADSLVVKYKDDGTVDSVVKLDEASRGEHFDAWTFGIFANGSFLVTGAELSEKHAPTKPFTAVFDRQGTFVAPLSLAHDVRPSSLKRPTRPSNSRRLSQTPQAEASGGSPANEGRNWVVDVQQGLMTGSVDGNLYLLRASTPARVYVITPAGSVLSELEVKPPELDMRPVQMSLAGQSNLLIEFSHDRSSGQSETRQSLALLDLGTGKITDTYRLPADAGICACAASRNEFLFLDTSKDNQLEVVKFAAR